MSVLRILPVVVVLAATGCAVHVTPESHGTDRYQPVPRPTTSTVAELRDRLAALEGGHRRLEAETASLRVTVDAGQRAADERRHEATELRGLQRTLWSVATVVALAVTLGAGGAIYALDAQSHRLAEQDERLAQCERVVRATLRRRRTEHASSGSSPSKRT